MWGIFEVHCNTTISNKVESNCDANIRKNIVPAVGKRGGGGELLLKVPGHDNTFFLESPFVAMTFFYDKANWAIVVASPFDRSKLEKFNGF